MKKYKALMLDLDGTTIPTMLDGVPSKKVIEAIRKANKLLHVGIVTARPYSLVKHLTKDLSLSGPSIISGGSQIIDFPGPGTRIMWEESISKSDASEICKYLLSLNLKFIIQYKGKDHGVDYDLSIPTNDAIDISIPNVSLSKADFIIDKLKKFNSVVAHKTTAWNGGGSWVQISSTKASKQHAILKVAEILKIQTSEIIGVGDGYNDFPLLMACGLKVAMGNAVTELKEIADYVAPSVEDDGVAWVIEKFIL
jgi:HAD superfamily hydrolase (TIGR01484 family)